MRGVMLVIACLAVASAMPIGQEDTVALVSEEVAPKQSSLQNLEKGFKSNLVRAETSAHPDIVSQALSNDMDDEYDEEQTLSKLVNDSENIDDDEELGEAPAATSDDASYTDTQAADQDEQARLSKQEEQAKALERKDEKLFAQMGSDFKAKADAKKQAAEIKKQANEALKAAEDMPNTKKAKVALGESATPTTAQNDADQEEMEKLNKLESSIKDKEAKSEKSMTKIETSYVEEKKSTEKMKKEMDEFKKEASDANKLADNDDPTSSELGESSDDLSDEMSALSDLQKHITQKMNQDEVHDMVTKSSHVINKFADSALKEINQIN